MNSSSGNCFENEKCGGAKVNLKNIVFFVSYKIPSTQSVKNETLRLKFRLKVKILSQHRCFTANIQLFWVRRCGGANEFKCFFLMIFRSHFCMCRLLIFSENKKIKNYK